MRRPLILTTLAVLSSMFLIACSGSRHSSDEIYYLVTTNSKIPYWQAAHDGWRQAAKKMQIRVEFVGPDKYDPKAEQAEFERVLKTKPSGILVSPADAK